MATTATSPKSWIDTKMFFTILLTIVVVIVAYVLYQKWSIPTGGITKAQYDALPAAEQTAYVLDPNGSGYYVKKTA